MTRWTRPLYGPLQPGRLHRGPLPLMFGLSFSEWIETHPPDGSN